MKTMKNMTKYIFGTCMALALFISCDKDFEEINTDPVRLTSIEGTFQLNRAIIGSSPGYNNFTYEEEIVRHMTTPFQGVGSGGNFNQDNRSRTAGNWQDGFRTTVKNLVDAIANGDPENVNLLSMLRIWKAHEFMILTDTYGEIPYFQAGKGFLEQIPFPEYDPQEAIYDDILKELEEASATLNPANDAVDQEIMYAGQGVGDNISAWKRLGYSLMLRAAMRLSKVNPAKAQEFTAKAITGGVMTSNEDNAAIWHDASFRNGLGTNLNGGQAPFYYIEREFMDYLQGNNDPRLSRIAVRYIGATSGADQIPENANYDPAEQRGLPQGYDNTTIDPIAQAEGLASFFDYSQLDRERLGGPEAPAFMVTYSQTLLLHAEAAFRGWAPGNANALYQAGIRAHMEQFTDWPGDTTISEAEIQAFLDTHVLTVGNELEDINTQYWVSAFLNGHEGWANFRRSGFPSIAPNPYPGSDLQTEEFIRRLTYPDTERTVNLANLEAAISRQGPDILDTRVWWDQ